MKMSRVLCGFFSLWISAAMASGSSKEFAEGINYIPITPALIVNYGGPSTKVRYIKAELSIRTENAADAKAITHHLPIIRDRLIAIFSTQTEESLSSAEGKEQLRLLALDEINAAVHMAEFGKLADGEDAKTDNSKTKSEKKKDSTKSDKAKKADQKKGDKSKAEEKPKKAPASDLFFNNFVVQK